MKLRLSCPNRHCSSELHYKVRSTPDETLVCDTCSQVFTYLHSVTIQCNELSPRGCSQSLRLPSRHSALEIRCPGCGARSELDFQASFAQGKRFLPVTIAEMDERFLGCNASHFESDEVGTREASRILRQVPKQQRVLLCRFHQPAPEFPRIVHGYCNFKSEAHWDYNYKVSALLAGWIAHGYPGVFFRSNGLDEVWFNDNELYDRFCELIGEYKSSYVLFDSNWLKRV